MKFVEPFAPRRGTPLPPGGFDLLAIDPGAHTGWAAFGCAHYTGDAGLNRLLACGSGSPTLEFAARVVIELPQIYPSHPVPPNDIITLAFLAGRYAGAAMPGVEVSTVFPHQWKGNLPKDVCAARVRAKLSLAERAIVDACDAPKGQMHNVLDAIGIGLFAEGRFAP